MSDAPQGPGWWQAADGKFYPPAAPAPPGQQPSPAAPPGWVLGADGQWHQTAPGQQPAQQKSNTGCIWAIVIAVVLALTIPIMAILAITFLGQSASEKFESIGTSISDAGDGETTTTMR